MGLVARRGHARKKQRPKTGRRKEGECLASFRHLLLYFGAALRLTAPCIRDSLTIDASTGPRSCQVRCLPFHLDVLGKPGSPAASACQAPAGRHHRWRSSGESSRRRRRVCNRGRCAGRMRRCTTAYLSRRRRISGQLAQHHWYLICRGPSSPPPRLRASRR